MTDKQLEWAAKQQGMTVRQFKQKKRRDLRAVIAALEEFRFGCMWIPGYEDAHEILYRIEILRKKLSIKEWGR
jgi:hypothetical protein